MISYFILYITYYFSYDHIYIFHTFPHIFQVDYLISGYLILDTNHIIWNTLFLLFWFSLLFLDVCLGHFLCFVFLKALNMDWGSICWLSFVFYIFSFSLILPLLSKFFITFSNISISTFRDFFY